MASSSAGKCPRHCVVNLHGCRLGKGVEGSATEMHGDEPAIVHVGAASTGTTGLASSESRHGRGCPSGGWKEMMTSCRRNVSTLVGGLDIQPHRIDAPSELQLNLNMDITVLLPVACHTGMH